MKFAFVAKHRGIWPVRWMCEALGVSRSGFHAWLTRSPSRRAGADEAIGARARTSFLASDRTYGARRVFSDWVVVVKVLLHFSRTVPQVTRFSSRSALVPPRDGVRTRCRSPAGLRRAARREARPSAGRLQVLFAQAAAARSPMLPTTPAARLPPAFPSRSDPFRRRPNRGLFQRYVQSGKILHGCSFSMLVAIPHRPRSHIPTGAAARIRARARPQSPHLTQKLTADGRDA